MAIKGGNWAAPRTEAAVVVPSDSTVLGGPDGVMLYVGGAGDVAVTMAGPEATVLTFKAVPAGAWLPILVTKVMATNTTATNINCVW